MDRPAVDRVDGVPPAIAIDQTNPVRSSRCTVGTMTELNDHLKLLFARAAELFDKQTAQRVRHDTPETIYAELMERTQADDPRLVVTFPVELPADTSAEEIEQWLSASGFTRVQAEREVASPTGPRKVLDVVADRFRIQGIEKVRAVEAIETALKRGSGRVNVYVAAPAASDERRAREPRGAGRPLALLDRPALPRQRPALRRSAAGAVLVQLGLRRLRDLPRLRPRDRRRLRPRHPRPRKTLRNGAIKTIQTPAWKECQDDLMKYAGEAGIPRDTPGRSSPRRSATGSIDGSPNWTGKWNQQWYGIKRFFEYLESKAYKMHIRVLLSKYRSYTPCPACGGARLKTEALLWRLGTQGRRRCGAAAGEALHAAAASAWSREQLEALPGLTVHDLMLMPIDRIRRFFDARRRCRARCSTTR